MSEEIKKKAGAQTGNNNARKYGFYTKAMDEEERQNFKLATEVEGLDGEIALLRVKILSLLTHEPDNVKLITQTVTALAKVIMTKYNIDKTDKQGISEGVLNVFKDIIIPGGGSILQFLKK
jgi:hypothetical protein